MTRTLIQRHGGVLACVSSLTHIQCARSGARLRLALSPAERALTELK